MAMGQVAGRRPQLSHLVEGVVEQTMGEKL